MEVADKKVEVTPFSAKGKVKAKLLNVREVNHTNSLRLGQLRLGQEINITGKANGWFEINYNGRKAYVSGAYVDLISSKAIENIPILINGKEFKKGYIINGVTYTRINGKDMPVRRIFESIGADVAWQDNKVKISM